LALRSSLERSRGEAVGRHQGRVENPSTLACFPPSHTLEEISFLIRRRGTLLSTVQEPNHSRLDIKNHTDHQKGTNDALIALRMPQVGLERLEGARLHAQLVKVVDLDDLEGPQDPEAEAMVAPGER